MLKIQTSDFDFTTLDNQANEWVYNALDCAVTSEVWTNVSQNVQDFTFPTYNFVSGMQAPAMQMAIRGMRIDEAKRNKWIASLTRRADKLEIALNLMAEAVWEKPLNANSPDQLRAFFYGAMSLPPEMKYNKQKKTREISTDRSALEKLSVHFYARPFINNILRTKDLKKKIGVLKTGIDPDGKMRTSYNVCGTETGRWSSNSNAMGTGTNLQNIQDELREIFIADEGMKMGYFDGEQAESRVVAHVSGDEAYIDACESGDLHTTVSRMVWPELDWGSDPAGWREVADQKFYRELSFRDMAKKLGHGTNYRGKARTMAMHAKLEVRIVEEFQDKYLTTFRGINEWHHSIANQLQTKGYLVTPLGRVRYFLGRRDSDDTLKEAIAFVPQSTIGEIVNEAMYRVWHELDDTRIIDNRNGNSHRAQLLAQIHDAILIQWPDLGDEYESQLIRKVISIMEVPIPMPSGRSLIIPANCEGTGWNWRKYHEKKNPQGLKKFNGKETRTREITNTSLLGKFYI